MKKINIEESLCIGCGACVAVDSEHFDFSDDGYSTVKSQDNLDTESLKNAIESCPTNAITCNCEENCECGDKCECEQCDCEKKEDQ